MNRTFSPRVIFGVIVGILLLGLIAWRISHPKDNTRTVATTTDTAATATAPEAAAPAADSRALDPYAANEGERHLAAGSRISVGADGARELLLPDGTVVQVDAKTALIIERMDRIQERWETQLRLENGAIRLAVPPGGGSRLRVVTPNGSIGVRGTEFAVSYAEADGAEVSVFSGQVEAASGNGSEQLLVNPGQAARLELRRVVAAAIRAEVEKRWAEHRARIADRLIEQYQLDIDSDNPPDLDAVLKRIPETLRERQRQRIQEQVELRRQELRSALRARADAANIEAMSSQERFTAARRNWIAADDRKREEFRQNAVRFHEQVARNLEALADTVAARGGDTGAARLREAAARSRREASAVGDSLARTALVEPQFAISVGPAEGRGAAPGARRLLVSPAPAIPRNHPLNQQAHTFVYRLKIGPGGFVNEVQFVSSTMPAEDGRKLAGLLRTWRFNADADRGQEWRTITVNSRPNPR